MTDEQQPKCFQDALDFAARKHAGQYRKGGESYITHPIAVAQILREKGYDMTYQICGLFHDLLEDTDATEEEILALGGPVVLETVKLLTKYPGFVMEEYVHNIHAHPIARAVKAADRLHNVQSAITTDETFKRRYILDTKRWYMDFGEDIVLALTELENSL